MIGLSHQRVAQLLPELDAPPGSWYWVIQLAGDSDHWYLSDANTWGTIGTAFVFDTPWSAEDALQNVPSGSGLVTRVYPVPR